MLPRIILVKASHTSFQRIFLRLYASRTIVTLDPTKLVSKNQAICDLSGVSHATFQSEWSLFQVPSRSRDKPFPPNTRGVVYYNVDPDLPPISGAIRFRLCNSLANFDRGEDLRLDPIKPWELSLTRLVHGKHYQGLVQHLLKEGLVQRDLISDIKRLPVTSPDLVGRTLYDLSQPFLLKLDTSFITFFLITRTSFDTLKFRNPLFQPKGTLWYYSGLAEVRLELSRRPEHEKQGPTLLLRFLDFRAPPRRLMPEGSGPYVFPANGSLLMRKTKLGSIKPWAYPLNFRKQGAPWKEFIDHLQK